VSGFAFAPANPIPDFMNGVRVRPCKSVFGLIREIRVRFDP
jgi:hypothetical protein